MVDEVASALHDVERTTRAGLNDIVKQLESLRGIEQAIHQHANILEAIEEQLKGTNKSLERLVGALIIVTSKTTESESSTESDS